MALVDSDLTVPELLEALRRKLEVGGIGIERSTASQRLDTLWESQYEKCIQDSVFITSQLRYRYNLQLPINAFPPEVLAKIFSHLQDATFRGVSALLPDLTWNSHFSAQWIGCFTSVCRIWRQVALSNKALWQHMYLSEYPSGVGSAAKQFLQRSSPLPIHLQLSVKIVQHANFLSNDILELFQTVRDSPHRFEYINLAGYILSNSALRDAFQSADFSSLTRLHIDFDQAEDRLTEYIDMDRMPEIRRLSFCKPGRLIRPSNSPSTLTHLLFFGSPNVTLEQEDVLSVLCITPRLQVLILETKIHALAKGRAHVQANLPDLVYLKLFYYSRGLSGPDDYPILLLSQLSISRDVTIVWNLPPVLGGNTGREIYDAYIASLAPSLCKVTSVAVYFAHSFSLGTYELHKNTFIVTNENSGGAFPVRWIASLKNVRSIALFGAHKYVRHLAVNVCTNMPFTELRELHLGEREVTSDLVAVIRKNSRHESLSNLYIWIEEGQTPTLDEIERKHPDLVSSLLESSIVNIERDDGSNLTFQLRYGNPIRDWRYWTLLQEM